MQNKYSEYRLFWQVCDQPTSRDSSKKNWHPPPWIWNAKESIPTFLHNKNIHNPRLIRSVRVFISFKLNWPARCILVKWLLNLRKLEATVQEEHLRIKTQTKLPPSQKCNGRCIWTIPIQTHQKYKNNPSRYVYSGFNGRNSVQNQIIQNQRGFTTCGTWYKINRKTNPVKCCNAQML